MPNKNPKLPLSVDERANLREAKIKLSDIHELETPELAHVLKTPKKRTRYIKALATFQKIPSIGHKFADTLVENLGYYSLNELKDKDGAVLLNQLESDLGYWVDRCVEDQIRCVIHHANHPGSTKQWFDFTDERKDFRRINGYPESRPEKAWHSQR
ncbi:Pathogenicity locus [Lentibacillus halodurans]|uniref:Pathogenicity locus n=1 Tax=Lentibacillus halodurans TaxID=237679 RepID=A0A1I0X361_9BACI|nr:helix-hairpin-helix domain-containing protein [Lentibacillus halodurans]SFA94840.1 Pathogenicity locus [Lentibacillus halodurans]